MKKGIPAALTSSLMERAQATSKGRDIFPVSEPRITQSTPFNRLERDNLSRSGSRTMILRPENHEKTSRRLRLARFSTDMDDARYDGTPEG